MDCKINKIKAIIHTAAQPSHDWALKEPITDFDINAKGTINLLEAFRKYCPEASFIFTSTNKVYGDAPNSLPLEDKKLQANYFFCIYSNCLKLFFLPHHQRLLQNSFL